MANKPTPEQLKDAAIEEALDALVEVLNERPMDDNWMEKANQRKADLSFALRKEEENERERVINCIKRVHDDPDWEKETQYPSALLVETAKKLGLNLISLKATDLISSAHLPGMPAKKVAWDHEEE